VSKCVEGKKAPVDAHERCRAAQEWPALRDGLFSCSGCSVMFLNDTTFNGWHEATPAIDPAPFVMPMRKRR